MWSLEALKISSNSVAIGAVAEEAIEDQLDSSTSSGIQAYLIASAGTPERTINSFESTFRGEFGQRIFCSSTPQPTPLLHS